MKLQDLNYLVNLENIDIYTIAIFGKLYFHIFFWIHLLTKCFWASIYMVSESAFLSGKCKTMSALPTLVNLVNIYLAPIMGHTFF